MNSTRRHSASTPVIAAALRRRPTVCVRREGEGGGGYKKNANNYVAAARVSIGHNSQKRIPTGAVEGNRNAVSGGRRSAEARAERAFWRSFERELDVLLEMIVAAHRAGIHHANAFRRLSVMFRGVRST